MTNEIPPRHEKDTDGEEAGQYTASLPIHTDKRPTGECIR